MNDAKPLFKIGNTYASAGHLTEEEARIIADRIKSSSECIGHVSVGRLALLVPVQDERSVIETIADDFRDLPDDHDARRVPGIGISSINRQDGSVAVAVGIHNRDLSTGRADELNRGIFGNSVARTAARDFQRHANSL